MQCDWRRPATRDGLCQILRGLLPLLAKAPRRTAAAQSLVKIGHDVDRPRGVGHSRLPVPEVELRIGAVVIRLRVRAVHRDRRRGVLGRGGPLPERVARRRPTDPRPDA